jgi:MraZ protein
VVAGFFNGEYRLAVDDKHRVLFPADARAQVNPEVHGSKFVLIIGPNQQAIWLYPEKTFERMATQLTSSLVPDKTQADLERLIFGRSVTVEPDKAGRLLLPDLQMKRTGIVKDVALLGARDRFELWPYDRWEAEEALLGGQMSELIEKFKASGLDKPPGT